ncbi:reverse transcriptase N-terminal domain-containing protein [Deinococcus sp. ME38]|uniref:reverse transcriptase N-terminal domain-containing protein n=1 Tax=Deinococcus sp. ME38 TaxID=3400344 RepID=UPI003B5A759E
MLVIEQTKGQPLKWQNINWTAAEGEVRRLQERIFRAAQNGEHAKVKNLSTRHFPKGLEKVRLTRENRTRPPMSWPS